jgi:hypothetical protein
MNGQWHASQEIRPVVFQEKFVFSLCKAVGRMYGAVNDKNSSVGVNRVQFNIQRFLGTLNPETMHFLGSC